MDLMFEAFNTDFFVHGNLFTWIWEHNILKLVKKISLTLQETFRCV